MRKPKPLAERLTPAMLKRLQSRKITNAEAAEKLGVSTTYLSRTVAALQTKEPGTSIIERAAATKIYKTRMERRQELAKRVLKKRMTLAEAAEQAQCSERTMFRYLALYRPTQ